MATTMFPQQDDPMAGAGMGGPGAGGPDAEQQREPLPMPPPARPPQPRDGMNAKGKDSASGVTRGHISTTIREDYELANEIRELFDQARAEKRKLMARWRRNYAFFRNRPNTLPPVDRAVPMIPEVFPIVSSKVGWKVDRRISHVVSAAATPATPHWSEVTQMAHELGLVMDATWHVNTEENEVTQAIWDAELYGTGILKTCWEMHLADGLGDAHIRRIDPFTFYPDPHARSMDDANYFIEARRMSLQELDRRFPGAAKRFTEGMFLEDAPSAPDQLGDGAQQPRSNPAAIAPATSPSYARTLGARVSVSADPGVTVLEAWLREHAHSDDDDAPYGRVTSDTWRCVVVVNNHILMDEPASNLWSHGQHPYSRYVPHDIGEFWGFATVELLVPAQASINRLLSALQTNVELTGNPILKAATNSGVNRTQQTNRAGSRLDVNPNGMVEWMVPPTTNQSMPDLIRYFLQRMEAVSGLSAITRGGAPSGRNAQQTVDAMQEAAFVRIRMELRQLEYTLRDAGMKKAALIIENYTQPRFIPIVGADGAKATLAIAARQFMLQGEDGSTPLSYTLLVDAGAGTHTSRKVREDQVFQWFTMGLIDEWAAMEMLDIPGRAETYKRLMYARAEGLENDPGARKQAQH